jgi:dimethylglycine dehydrogenase
VTSGGYGHRIGQSIALGYVSVEQSTCGTELYVDILGQRVRAVVATEPLYDPENDKLKS